MPSKTRTLILKKVNYNQDNKKSSCPPIQEILKIAVESTNSIAERHYPDLKKSSNNSWELPEKWKKSCAFINCFDIGNRGVLFEICSYTPGHTALKMISNFEANEANISPYLITDPDTGAPCEIIMVRRCLAFGEIIIMESIKGGGGLSLLESCLNYKAQKVDKDWPTMRLTDVLKQDFTRTLESAKGIAEVTIDLVYSAIDPNRSYSKLLSDMTKKINGTETLTVCHKSKENKLNKNDVLSLYREVDEVDDSENIINKIALRFNDGRILNNLGEYQIRKEITISSVDNADNNKQDYYKIGKEMEDFLVELQTPVNGYRTLNEQGFFVPLS
jgi:major membrane immunogen (membrane-anchored lipoprotein)